MFVYIVFYPFTSVGFYKYHFDLKGLFTSEKYAQICLPLEEDFYNVM